MAERRLIVAIDGPSGTGKSSVSKEVARRLGIGYLDTGAMYRAAAWWCRHQGIDLDDQAAVAAATRTMPLVIGTTPDDPRVSVDGIAIDQAIRQSDISEVVSKVATNLDVRAIMKRRQQRLIREICDATGGVVAEGRDITTVVAPYAEARILMTASEAVRMGRRSKELSVDAEATRAQIVERDARDSTVAQFRTAADGVVTVDTSELDFEQSVEAVLAAIGPKADGYGPCAKHVDAEPVSWQTELAEVMPHDLRRRLPRAGRRFGAVAVRAVYSVTVEHAGRVPKSGAIVLVSAHSAFLDGPVLFCVAPRTVSFLVKRSYFQGALGLLLRAVGQIPITQNTADRRSLQEAVEVLASGGAVGVFPEGTRGEGTVEKVQQGAAWLALQTRALVVPVAIAGTRPAHGGNDGWPRPRSRLRIVFGRPFEVEAPTGVPGRERLRIATEHLRAMLAEHTASVRS